MRLRFLLFIYLFFVVNLEAQKDQKTKQQERVESTHEVTVSENSFVENLKNADFTNVDFPEDVVIGDKKAPNTVIVYSSFTCSHCQEFHTDELAKIIKKYVPIGKVKIILRQYIDDMGALEASTLISCLCGNSSEKNIDTQHKVFMNQKKWMESQDPKSKLRNMFVSFGFPMENVAKCVEDKKIQASLMKEHKRATHDLKIRIIPAIVINGKVYQGKLTMEEIEKLLNFIK
ncbi:MAG: DsbA family protein [Holosporaceae bacterium]|jgi:protein-disulfide isomerase|nr:DsbA family protein [Holosporaceae bacterium]